MAIRKSKYVDITSGIGGRDAVGRRNLGGRVFTMHPALAYQGVRSFGTADEVMNFFGSDSAEYRFAVKYFSFISKSITTPERISFASWGHANEDIGWKSYAVTVDMTGVTTKDEDGKTSRYDSLNACLAEIKDNAIFDIVLQKDLVYISEATCDDAKHYAAVMECITDAPIVTADADLLTGLKIRPNQLVRLDLNGHAFSSDTYCVVNEGVLIVSDSKGYGRMFTTNLESKIGEVPHGGVDRSASGSETTTAAIKNLGSLAINGGWFGTGKHTTAEYMNSMNWGSAIACYDQSKTTINGGYFTTCTFSDQAVKVAADTGDANIFTTKNGETVTQNYGEDFHPAASVIALYNRAVMTINGGTVFGLANQLAEFVEDLNRTTPEDFGVLEINGGTFVYGFPGVNYIPETRFDGQAILKVSTMTALEPPTKYPSGEHGYSVAHLKAGTFLDNISLLSTTGGNGRMIAATDERMPLLRFTGRIVAGGISANFSFSDAFKTFRQDYALPVGDENPVDALARIDEADENFGSFAFIDDIGTENIGKVAAWNAAKNYKYLYSVRVTPDTCKDVLRAIQGVSGTVVTLDKFDAMAEFMPMALFAATKYDRVNASKVFMYQQFAGELPSVTTTAEADKYDAFDVDGLGTKFPVNYLGNTQQAGTLVRFYQDGYNVDALDTACYCNEIWLKDAILVALLNLFIAQEKIPANDVGVTMCEHSILSVIADGIRNGTIIANKDLTQAQKTYIDKTAGIEGAWEDVWSKGYWLGIVVRKRTLEGGRDQYYADYVLIYSKGDAIRKVEGADILI